MTLDCHHLPVALKVCVKCVFCPFVLPTMRVQVCCQGPSRGTPTELDLEKVNVRGREFSELLSHWRVPLDTGNFIASTSIGPGHSADSSKVLHAALANPVSVLSMPVSVSESKGYWLDLSSLFPIATGMWTPHLNMAPLSHGRMLLHEGLA
ncbi:von Willebrand factor A domain-containing protein 8, partial [Geodia barretti]